MPKRIQLRRTKGWRMPPNTVKVARPTRWGNPYTVKRWGRDGAIRKYRLWLELKIGCGLDLSPLRGKNLACFCPLDQACHADVLLEFANVCRPMEKEP